jgi:probable HAF family extracellular repeat protein
MSRSRFGLTTLALLSLATSPDAGAYAQKATPAYTFTDLGGLPNPNFVASEARAVNDSGQVVGLSYVTRPSGTVYHPVVWAKDATGKFVITDLGTLGGNSGKALGINSQGEIVGITQGADTGIYAFLIHPLTVNGSKVWYQDLNLDGINDLMTNLGVAVDDSENKGISDNTQIAAGVNLVQFDAAGNEVVTTLPRNGVGAAINDNRQVAGSVALSQPAIWQVDAAGNALSMITLSPLTGYTQGAAVCINALGQAAGASSNVSGNLAYPRATLWQGGATPTDLGALATQSTSEAMGINTVNGVLQVVGAADIFNHGERAFVWKNGVMTDLNTLISASGVTVSGAFAINAQGQIAGRGYVTVGKNNTELHGYLLTPK